MTESTEGEIRNLRTLFWSDRDPEGMGFAALADAYRRAGDFRQAIELLNDGIDRHPRFTPGHVVSARLYVERGLSEEGEIAARRALDLDSENIDALGLLVGALEQLDNLAEAKQVRGRLALLDGPDEAPQDVGADDGVVAAAEMDAPVAEDMAFEAVDLAALAPDASVGLEDEDADVDVFDLGLLAPDEVVMDLGGLAPDEVVMDLGELAPDDVVMDLAALAPDEVVMDLGELAPDEPVMELDALAPDDVVMDLGALAPDEPVMELDALAPDDVVMDLGALAPDEPVMELDALAPDDVVMDLGALAPDEVVMELDALAPDDVVMDLGALAPDEVVSDLGALAPGEPVMELDTLAPEYESFEHDATEESEDVDDAAEPAEKPIYTRTMADLYERQGLVDRALDVYRHLLAQNPHDPTLAARVAELESGDKQATDPAPAGVVEGAVFEGAASTDDEEVEVHARHLAESGHGAHEVATPFAWTEEESDDPGDEPSIVDFFDALLGWAHEDRPDAR